MTLTKHTTVFSFSPKYLALSIALGFCWAEHFILYLGWELGQRLTGWEMLMLITTTPLLLQLLVCLVSRSVWQLLVHWWLNIITFAIKGCRTWWGGGNRRGTILRLFWVGGCFLYQKTHLLKYSIFVQVASSQHSHTTNSQISDKLPSSSQSSEQQSSEFSWQPSSSQSSTDSQMSDIMDDLDTDSRWNSA